MKRMLNAFFYSVVFLTFLSMAAAIVFAAYSGLYVMNHLDRTINDFNLAYVRMEQMAKRLDAHAEFLIRKSSQIERKTPGGTPGSQGGMNGKILR